MSSQQSNKPRHLGRGLESLLGPLVDVPAASLDGGSADPPAVDLPADTELQQALRVLDISCISTNPYQPRRTWDSDDLAALAESIKTNGLVQPIIVRRAGDKYQLIAGERRLRAAQLAGVAAVPALVREASDEQMLELALIENIHRRDLNPIERAEAYLNYINRFSLTQAQAAERLGEDRSVIANYLRLLDLPDDLKQMLIDGQLTMGHARAILGLPSDELRRRIANRALAGRLSVRELERLVRRYTEKATATGARAAKLPHIVDLENRLSAELGTRVSIEPRRGGRRGRIVIEFFSLEEFDRIVEKIGLRSAEEV